MDYDTPFCPVCDKQITPKRTTEVLPLNGSFIRKNSNINRTVPRTRTVIEQGPSPLYCSDECKMADLKTQQDVYAPPTYHIYPLGGSPPSDIESDSLCSMSTTSSSNPVPCQPKQRSRSFLSGRQSRGSTARYAPASLPTTSTLSDADGNLLSQFHGSFNRRCESRVSMYSGPSSPTSSASVLSTSPRHERPLLANGAEGKLLVPDVFVRRPTTSRRESSSSLASMASISSAPGAMTTRNRTGSLASVGSSRASITSPLARYGSDFGDDENRYDLSEEDESYDGEDTAPLSPGLGFGAGFSSKRPLMSDMRAWSFDTAAGTGSAFSTIREPRKQRRGSEKKEREDRQSYNPDGKRLFLFPTD